MSETLDPIELKVLMNSPEVEQQSQQVSNSLRGVDSSIEASKKELSEYITTELEIWKGKFKTIQVTKEQVTALDGYSKRLVFIQEQLKKTFDPTQVALYRQELKKISTAIEGIERAAIKNPLVPSAPGVPVPTTPLPDSKTLELSTKRINNLKFSIAQISREMPAFTYSMQTGFMAISNNIPILTDQIKALKLHNQELMASGQKGVPIWKTLLSGMFSWQTAMTIGITLLTVYGKEIGNWISSLFRSEAALNKNKIIAESLNKARMDGLKGAQQELTHLKLLYGATQDHNRSLTERKKAVDALQKEYPKYFKNLSDEDILAGKAAGTYNKLAAAILASAKARAAQDKIVENEKKLLELEDKRIGNIALQIIAEKNLNKVKAQNADIMQGKAADAYKEGGGGSIMAANRAISEAREKVEKYGKEIKKTTEEQDALKKSNERLAASINPLDLDFNAKEKPGKANKSGEKILDARKDLLAKIAELDNDYAQKKYNKDEQEIADLKEKFGKIRVLIEKFNSKHPALAISIAGLDNIENKSIENLKYKQGTEALIKQLSQEKDIYAGFEALKTKIAGSEAAKRYAGELDTAKTFSQRISDEIAKIGQTNDPKQLERIVKLGELLEKFEKDKKKAEESKFVEAYQSAISHQERLNSVEKEFQDKRAEIGKITDENIRNEKLNVLQQQYKDAVDSANAEAYAKTQIFEKGTTNLLGITKKDLQNRIASLKEFLKEAKNLTPEQRQRFTNELTRAEGLMGKSDLDVKKNTLLERRNQLLEKMRQQKNAGNQVTDETYQEYEKINAELKEISQERMAEFANGAREVSSIFGDLAGMAEGLDEGLADTLGTIGQLAGAAASVAEGLASVNPLKIIGGIVKGISAIVSLNKAARESERKAQQEIKEYHDKIFESQLAYNSALRQRILDEIKLNDLYKSRVDNIKEEIAANEKNKKNIVEDQQAVFNRLLGAQTVTGMHTKKYGGFLGMGRKTKAVEETNSVAELLGLGSYQRANGMAGAFGARQFIPTQDIKMTDELFDKLEKINRDKPLTGDAKAAFEQLKKLRDEYGSIEKAQRELEKELKDAIVGSTAQQIGDTIREGILSGKKDFVDFGDDIEDILRNAMIAGMNAKIIEPQMQQLQDALYEYMGDGVMSDDEKKQFREMYMKVANEAKNYADMVKESGIDIEKGANEANSLKGAVKGITETQADLLAGQFGGLRLAQLDTNQIIKASAASQMQQNSEMLKVQQEIEYNTRVTAKNTGDTADNTGKIWKTITDIWNKLNSNDLRNSGR